MTNAGSALAAGESFKVLVRVAEGQANAAADLMRELGMDPVYAFDRINMISPETVRSDKAGNCAAAAPHHNGFGLRPSLSEQFLFSISICISGQIFLAQKGAIQSAGATCGLF